MTNDIISISSAIQAAADYAGYALEDIRCTEKHYAGGLFEICFNTDWSKVDCFVDAATGEVVGFNSEPYIDSDYIFDQEGGAAWRFNIAASK